MLEIRGVTRSFAGVRALADVDVREREIVAVIGPNGAGKTTLLNIVSGVLRPDTGSVTYRGRRIDGRPPHEVTRLGVARTFQALELFRRLTVRDNVIAGGVAAAGVGVVASLLRAPSVRRAERELRARADAALALVGLADAANDSAGVLPAGHQRLLAIARAVATGADVLLLDEPGAGLNAVEKTHLVDVIAELRRAGATIVFIEHDMSLVSRLADRVVVLDHGRVIARGSADDARRDAAVVEAYLGAAGSPAPRRPGGTRARESAPMLVVDRLDVAYGGVRALDRVSLDVAHGEIVAIVGANGAGKTTLLRAISRVAPLTGGDVRLAGASLARCRAEDVVRAGISHVPEGRELFPSLTVWDNLVLGRYARLFTGRNLLVGVARARRSRTELEHLAEHVFAVFPALRERRRQLAGTLSGGEGQMLAIGRALMASPRLLMLDEPSLGLAPKVVAQIMDRLAELRAAGLTILLVEQNARAALTIADRGYVLETGRVAAQGDAGDLLADAHVTRAYLGGDVGTAAATRGTTTA